MGEKRAYKARKSGGGRKKLKPEYDAGKNMKEQIQFIQALLEANELAVGKDHQFKGRYEAEKNAVIISLEKDEREW